MSIDIETRNANNTNDNVNEKKEVYNIVEYETWDEMEELQNNQDLLRGIYSYGFEKPSPIQKKAIKPLMDGKDVIAQAQSGTGKTGCFTIGTLYKVNPEINAVQCMILSPTRELSRQILSVLHELSHGFIVVAASRITPAI